MGMRERRTTTLYSTGRGRRTIVIYHIHSLALLSPSPPAYFHEELRDASRQNWDDLRGGDALSIRARRP